MLQRLNLRENNFIGGFPVWVANMKSLVYLDISSNHLTGPLPFNCSGLQNLQELYLSHNFLWGIIPPWLFTLPSLEYLALSSNLFAGQIPEFKRNLPLLDISLSDNKLHGTIPQSIYTLVNLTYLLLSSNDLSGGVDLQKLKNLKYLDLSNTNLSLITTSGANNTFPSLREIYMSSCNIEVVPDFLRTSEKLVRRDISNNIIRGQIPNWVGFIGKASLSYLNLSHNFLTDIKQLPWERLQTLVLHSNSLQGQLPTPPPSIQYFFISNNSLSGEIPSLICNASSLQILDLSAQEGGEIEKNGYRHFGKKKVTNIGSHPSTERRRKLLLLLEIIME
ncbi:hypothetical protein Vadar_034113 [Vaccinium darrowii]|uniref:Uncharacterized protein n=1 Tax=Vaccinium darrowii TaxID=229202 RepID=A0ACB7YBU1_9ERIC|nr:hypothetical protein Vadar_034113 [Vaccinium darrowii]